MVYTDFVMTDEAFTRYYGGATYYAHSEAAARLGLRERVQRDASRLNDGDALGWANALRVKLLSRFMLVHLPGGRGRRILDIGCGAGKLLSAASAAGYACFGAEPSPDARQVLQKAGITAYSTVFEPTIPRDHFDVVVFNQSLEHMPDPMAALRRAAELVRPDGQLIVSVPNFASIESQVFFPYWRHLDVPRHLHHFSPDALLAAGRSLGLRLVDSRFKFWGFPTSTIALAAQQTGMRAYVKAGAFVLRQAMALITGNRHASGSMMSFTFKRTSSPAVLAGTPGSGRPL